jgi:endonuclease/exonuclease/phosphatase family metal-dependent hydrolase
MNLWDLPAAFGHLTRERVRLVSERLPSLDCDVLVFQEVWTSESRSVLVSGGQRAGNRHVWRPQPSKTGGGLLVLSREPIRSADFVPYVLTGLPQRVSHADYYGGKGFVRLTIDAESPYVLFGTHLHARYTAADEPDEYLGHRIAEVVELAAAIRAESQPVLAIGDFNFRETSPEYRILMGLTGLGDVAVSLDARQPTVTLSNSYRLARGATGESRLDYVFYRDGQERGVHPASIRRVLDESVEVAGMPGNYSDHAGLLAEVELLGAGAPVPPVDPAAIAEGQALLASGRHLAEERRAGARLAAGSGLLAGAAALAVSRSSRISRRRLLRAAFLGLGGAAWASCAGLAAISELFAPQELAGYAHASALLAELSGAQAARRDPRRLHSLRWSGALPGGHLRSGRSRARLSPARHRPL